MTTDANVTIVAKLKRAARLRSKAEGLPLRQVLDGIAREAGYSHWGAYRTSLGTPEIPGKSTMPDEARLPRIIADALAHPDMHAFCVNADGSAWIDAGNGERPLWRRFHRCAAADPAGIRRFLRRIGSHVAANATSYGAFDHRGAMHRIAMRVRDDASPIEMTIRRRPRTAASGPHLRTTRWHVDLVSTRQANAPFRACSVAMGDLNSHNRLVTFGLDGDLPQHGNRCELHDAVTDVSEGVRILQRFAPDNMTNVTRLAVEYGMRVCPDAIVVKADSPVRAKAGLALAYATGRPTALLLDAPGRDMLAHLRDMVMLPSAGDHPGFDMPPETYGIFPQIVDSCTVHV